jgi:hypothetical protein
MKSAGIVELFIARLIVTRPSSNVSPLNSGISSRKRTPCGPWRSAPTAEVATDNEPGVADGVVRRARRAHGHQRLAGLRWPMAL